MRSPISSLIGDNRKELGYTAKDGEKEICTRRERYFFTLYILTKDEIKC